MQSVGACCLPPLCGLRPCIGRALVAACGAGGRGLLDAGGAEARAGRAPSRAADSPGL